MFPFAGFMQLELNNIPFDSGPDNMFPERLLCQSKLMKNFDKPWFKMIFHKSPPFICPLPMMASYRIYKTLRGLPDISGIRYFRLHQLYKFVEGLLPPEVAHFCRYDLRYSVLRDSDF